MAKIATDKLEQEIRPIVAKILEIDEVKITPSARFVEDLGMDSMMALEILASLEKKFKVEIPEEYLGKISSLEELVTIAGQLLEKK